MNNPNAQMLKIVITSATVSYFWIFWEMGISSLRFLPFIRHSRTLKIICLIFLMLKHKFKGTSILQETWRKNCRCLFFICIFWMISETTFYNCAASHIVIGEETAMIANRTFCTVGELVNQVYSVAKIITLFGIWVIWV